MSEENKALAVINKDQLPRLTTDNLVERVRLIAEVMERVMKKDEHYGKIPGTPKPTLLKPGAEKLCNTFMLDPQYEEVNCHEGEDFVSFRIRCTLYHQTTGNRIASGLGACNSREKKYRYAWLDRKEKPTKEEADKLKADGLGRWRNTGTKERPSWTWQDRKDNSNPMDLQNTMYKMACKRALVAATLNATGASDIFTQDLEDLQADQEPAKEAEAEVVGEGAKGGEAGRASPQEAEAGGSTASTSLPTDPPPTEQERVEKAFGGEEVPPQDPSTEPTHQEPKPGGASVKQVGFIYSLLANKKGIKDRDEAHKWVSNHLAMTITTMNELTMKEAKSIIDGLLKSK